MGDSILGGKVHLGGAGAIISNLKSVQGGLVRIKYNGQVLETGLRKLGAILGDGGVEVGCNAVLNPRYGGGPGGTVIYPPVTSVRGVLPAGMILRERASSFLAVNVGGWQPQGE